MTAPTHSFMRAAIGACAALCLLHDLPARAQAPADPVGPAEIYAACHHPAASEANTQLWNLCHRIVLPPGNLAFRPAALTQISALPLPSPKEIRELATDAETRQVALPLLGGFLSRRPEAPELLFEESSAVLDTTDQKLISAVASEAIGHLARHPDARVQVIGYASRDNSRQGVNEDIADQRARAVAAELVKNGVSAERIDFRADVSPLAGDDVVTREEVAASRGATVSVLAPAIALSPGVARPRTATLQPDAPAVQAGSAAAQPDAAGGLSLSGLAGQATDVLVDRANVQVQVYVVREFGERLCPSDAAAQPSPRAVVGRYDLRAVGRHMRATCSLLQQGSLGFSPTGLGELRLAVQRDLQTMPQRLGFQSLVERKQHYAGEPRYADAANVLLAVLMFFDQVQSGADPLRAAAAFDRPRLEGPGGISWQFQPSDAGLPYTDGLRRFARFAAQVDTARRELAPYAADGWAVADTAFTYVLRSLAVQWHASGRTDPAVAWLAGDGFANVDLALGAYRDVNAGIDRIRSLRARADSLLASGDGGQEARRALYDEGLRVLSGVAPSLFLVDENRLQEVRSLVEPVRRVVSGVSAGRYGEAAIALVDVLGAPALDLEREWGPRLTNLRMRADSIAAEARTVHGQFAAARERAGTLRGEAAARARGEIAALDARVKAVAADSVRMRALVDTALTYVRTAGLPTLDEQATVRVLSLVAGIVEARSDDQAGQALRAFVGQGGDFLSKRQSGSAWRVALNAYVGLGGGLEVLNNEPGVGKRAAGYGSIYLPIGVELSRGCVGNASCGIFVPLVDLGAIAATRFGGGDVEDSPDVEVGRLFTPGLYGVLGLRGLPLSFGAGVTIAPDARERTDTDTLEDDADRHVGVWRFGMFLAVDIPLFP